MRATTSNMRPPEISERRTATRASIWSRGRHEPPPAGGMTLTESAKFEPITPRIISFSRTTSRSPHLFNRPAPRAAPCTCVPSTQGYPLRNFVLRISAHVELTVVDCCQPDSTGLFHHGLVKACMAVAPPDLRPCVGSIMSAKLSCCGELLRTAHTVQHAPGGPLQPKNNNARYYLSVWEMSPVYLLPKGVYHHGGVPDF